MCLGVRSPPNMNKGRIGGAGPAGGRYFIIPRTVTKPTNVPFQGRFIPRSPYKVKATGRKFPVETILLYENESPIMEFSMVTTPRFLYKKTSKGIPMWKLAALHGTDTIATTVNKRCIYWQDGRHCRFCTIQQNIKWHSSRSLAAKDPIQLAEVILEAEKNNVCKHVTLTTGTPGTVDKGVKSLIPYIKKIKEVSKTPIHVQFEPPKNITDMDLLYNSGVDTVGIHIETLDEKVRKSICPGKAEVSRKKYFDTWRKALNLFGENQVSTFILVGLGENVDKTRAGLKELTSVGVIPFIVPFRPLLGSNMENFNPPMPNQVLETLEAAIAAIKSPGLSPEKNKAGCVRCGACSPIKEALKYGVN
jgi:radical SAM protein (TIGR04043 family)